MTFNWKSVFKLSGLAACAALAGAQPTFARPVADAVAERTGPHKITVRWSMDGPVDVLLAAKPDAQPAEARLVSAKDADGSHVIEETGLARGFILLRSRKNGRVVKVAERLLPLDGGSNFRDIGGYATAEGRQVRWGLIYRSGGTPMLTASDLDRIKALNLSAMLDLRSSEERTIAPSRIAGVPYAAVGYSMMPLISNVNGGSDTIYRGLPKMLAPQLRLLFADLLRAQQPLVYNCSAGQDRTGFATAMILTALGVPRQTILADYHLSTALRRPENEMPKLSPAMMETSPVAAFFGRYQENVAIRKPQPLIAPDGTSYLSYAFDEVEKTHGSVEGYLQRELGVGPAEIARLRKMYTD